MDPICFFAGALTPFINAVVTQLDSEAFAVLEPFDNKIVCFQIDTLEPLYFIIHPTGLELITFNPNTDHCDLTFSGPFRAFIALVFTRKHAQHGLHVRGDLECAKALYDAWQHLDLDWEGYFAKWVGGDIAHGVNKGWKAWREYLHQTWENRVEDVGAYLQDEKAILPTRNEVENWIAQIDTLRLDTERFEAKLRLLQQRINQGKAP